MGRRWTSCSAGALGLALLQGCSEVCACTPTMSVAVVTGVVRHGDAPAPQATVHAFSADGAGCQTLGVEFDQAVTGTNGEFLMELIASPGLDDVCVYVYARPDGIADDSQDSDTSLVVLDFALDAPSDTARVTLTFPAP